MRRGFTLIELVIVIVLLGVLSAIAVTRFVNLEDDAQKAALGATAAALTSAMNINYAECAVNNHRTAPTVPTSQCQPVSTCEGLTGAAAVVQGGATSLSGYTITAAAIGAGNGTTLDCTIAKTGLTGETRTFTAVRAGT